MSTTIDDLNNRIYNKATGQLKKEALGQLPSPTPPPQPVQRLSQQPAGNDIGNGVVNARLAGGNEASKVQAQQQQQTKTSVQPTQIATTAAPVSNTKPQSKTYSLDEITREIDALEREQYQPLTAEDLEKQRKRRKREAILSAIGDGISSLSNLYFTSQGAQNSYNPSLSLSARAQARWDKQKAEHEANKAKYLEYLLRKQNVALAQKKNEDANAIDMLKTKADIAYRQNEALRDQLNEDREYNLKVQQGRDSWEKFEKEQEFKAKEGAKNRANSANIARIRSRNAGKGSSSTRDPHTTQWYETKVGELYNSLDEKYKENVGRPIKDAAGRVIGHETPSITDMTAAIGVAMSEDPEIKKRAEDTFTRGTDLSAYGRKKSPFEQETEDTDW